MIKTREFHFAAKDGKTLIYAKEWLPEGAAPKGILQIAHGIAEHIERYAHFAEFMASQGFLVVGNDHLGHGRTAPTPQDYGFFSDKEGWFVATEVVFQLYAIKKAEYPDIPYILLGHSMGSFLLRTLMIVHPNTIDAAILSGTGQNTGIKVTGGLLLARLISLFIGKKGRSPFLQKLCFGTYNHQFRPCRTGSDWISSDQGVVDKYIADPACQFIPTTGLFRDLLTGVSFIAKQKNVNRMQKNLPIYFFSGEKDPVGDNGKGVKRVYTTFQRAGCTQLWLKLYPGGRHEMLNETNRLQVYEDLLAWINTNVV